MQRQLKDWLTGYKTYVDLIKHEAPHVFHLWIGLSVIAAALERKVWYRLVVRNLYPNMYVVLVAPPGRCRKGGAMTIGASILEGLEKKVNLSSESLTKEALYHDLTSSEQTIQVGPEFYVHSSLTALSEELDSFLKVSDPEFIPALCDLYDCKNQWTYKTRSRGEETITGVWLNILGATVPPGYSNALSPNVISSGFSARTIFVYANKKQRRNARTIRDPRITELMNMLVNDLNIIRELYGEYKFTGEAYDEWNAWYEGLPDDLNVPEYIQTHMERKHAHVLKVSMLSAASKSNELVITKYDLRDAIKIVSSVEYSLHKVFAGVGRSPSAVDTNIFLDELFSKGRVIKSKFMAEHAMDMNSRSFDEVIRTLEYTGKLRIIMKGEDVIYERKG